LGPLDHGRPISRSKVAHVISSQVIEGGKLEREGADRQDQEEGQVGGDGGKWINSGLSEQVRFNCATTGRNCPGRLVAAGGNDWDPFKGRSAQNHTNTLRVTCTASQDAKVDP